MTRQLTGHIVNPANDKLTITVEDEPGSGGANHRYMIRGAEFHRNASTSDNDPFDVVLLFQQGPIDAHGVNGITHEALLAVLIDRLEGFQAGPFASHYNDRALKYLQQAQETLLNRTRERIARGVEGKLQA